MFLLLDMKRLTKTGLFIALMSGVLLFALITQTHVIDFTELRSWSTDSHWQMTLIRIGVFLLLLGSYYGLKRYQIHSNSDNTYSLYEAIRKLNRLSMQLLGWFGVIELCLGQALIPRLISIFL